MSEERRFKPGDRVRVVNQGYLHNGDVACFDFVGVEGTVLAMKGPDSMAVVKPDSWPYPKDWGYVEGEAFCTYEVHLELVSSSAKLPNGTHACRCDLLAMMREGCKCGGK